MVTLFSSVSSWSNSDASRANDVGSTPACCAFLATRERISPARSEDVERDEDGEGPRLTNEEAGGDEDGKEMEEAEAKCAGRTWLLTSPCCAATGSEKVAGATEPLGKRACECG